MGGPVKGKEIGCDDGGNSHVLLERVVSASLRDPLVFS